jgi:hypothetical protein
MTWTPRLSATASAAALVLLLSQAPDARADAAINFDGFSYTGDVTVYDTADDARNETNARSGPHGIPTGTNGTRSTLPNARDAALLADTQSNSFLFLTAWYFTPTVFAGNADGSGNPNNTNTGFIQLYDLDGSSVDSLALGWNDDRTEFSVSATGENAGSSEIARLWPAPTVGGAAAISAGNFLEYELDFTAGFNTPAGITDSLYAKDAFPDSVSGGFTGIFENTNTTNPSLNGFYRIDFAFQNESWAKNTGAVAQFRDDGEIATTFQQIPLPATAPLLLLGLAALAAVTRRRAGAALAA